MKATILDLRRRMADVLRAIDRGESVTVLYRGKEKAVLVPAEAKPAVSAAAHPAFGMWADRDDMEDVAAHVRSLRKRRF